jgi:hypothetical protein
MPTVIQMVPNLKLLAMQIETFNTVLITDVVAWMARRMS